jgi:hypothetical protein
VTAYKIISRLSVDDDRDAVYLRGGHHSSTKGRGGEASCYKGRLYKDGRVAIVKEIYHPAYTSNRVGRRATQEVKNK